MDALSFVLDSTNVSTVNRVFLKCNYETEKQAFFFSYAAFSTLGKTSPLSGSNYIFVVARVVELLRSTVSHPRFYLQHGYIRFSYILLLI